MLYKQNQIGILEFIDEMVCNIENLFLETEGGFLMNLSGHVLGAAH
ncbi:MAG: hypothetical protein ACLFP8_06360 [Alphaproteobacteria bacterium]